MEKQKELIRITSEYFEHTIHYLKLLNTSKEYKNFLNEIGGQELDTELGRNDIFLDDGKALGTLWAAMCIDDLIRTRQFIRGINNAIVEKMNDKASIHILYAGTGPFATLLLPIILRYPKEKIKYTLLEINPFTFEILQKVISALSLEDYDIQLLNEDATKYQMADDIPDIIISETMQNALAKEQQVPIFLNLMHQAKSDSIFIPEKVEIFLGLKKAGIASEELQKEHYHKEKKIFELSKETLFTDLQIENQSAEVITFPQKKTIISKEKLKGYNQLVLLTEIQVYKEEKIGINESGLTTALAIKDISDNIIDSMTVKTQYKVCTEPKLEYEIA
jgi:predicted RNA methylase